jgi:hypothetical protein
MPNRKNITTVYAVAIEVAKTPQHVFACLLTNVAGFWPETFEGACSRLHDEFTFTTGNSHYSKNKVAEMVPDKKLVWLVIDSIRKTDNYSWTGTKMIFELNPSDTGTILTFTYNGVVLEKEKERLAQVCNFVIKENLYNLLTGKK